MKEELIRIELPYPDGTDREVLVYIPARTGEQTFPVVYMTDGQTLFEESPDQFGCWHVREAVRSMQQADGKAAIIVGINTDTPDRGNELTPGSIGRVNCPEEVRDKVHPGGDTFDEFVVRTVMPYVEEQFPVKKGRRNTAFCGSSMGGLQSFFTALSHPDIFCAAGVFSPVFLVFVEEDFHSFIRKKLGEQLPYLYIYSGAGDDMEKQLYPGVERTCSFLRDCYPPELLNKVIMPEQRHHESAWEPVFKDFLHIFLTQEWKQ